MVRSLNELPFFDRPCLARGLQILPSLLLALQIFIEHEQHSPNPAPKLPPLDQIWIFKLENYTGQQLSTARAVAGNEISISKLFLLLSLSEFIWQKLQLFCSSSHWPGQANNSLKNYCICAEIVHNSQFKSESHPPATTARGCGNDRHGRCCWCSRCWYRTRKAKTSNIYSIISFDFHAFCTMLMIKGACAIYVAGKCVDADCMFCFGRVNYQEVVNDSKEVVKDCLCLILWYWAEIDSLRQLI